MKSKLRRVLPAAGPAGLIGLVLMTIPGLASASAGLTRDELLDMLGAKIGTGVIARQLESEGLAFRPAPADLVALKKAGASDRLLEAVLDAAMRPVAAAPASGNRLEPDGSGTGTRIFASTDATGRPVLVLTNLDESGARLDPAGAEEPLSMIVREAPRPALEEEADPAPAKYDESTEPDPDTRTLIQVIQNAAPAPADPPPAPAHVQTNPCAWGGCNVIATGGTVGTYRYPDHLWFLGYKP
jgi:hypothetical protein